MHRCRGPVHSVPGADIDPENLAHITMVNVSADTEHWLLMCLDA